MNKWKTKAIESSVKWIRYWYLVEVTTVWPKEDAHSIIAGVEVKTTVMQLNSLAYIDSMYNVLYTSWATVFYDYIIKRIKTFALSTVVENTIEYVILSSWQLIICWADELKNPLARIRLGTSHGVDLLLTSIL